MTSSSTITRPSQPNSKPVSNSIPSKQPNKSSVCDLTKQPNQTDSTSTQQIQHTPSTLFKSSKNKDTPVKLKYEQILR